MTDDPTRPPEPTAWADLRRLADEVRVKLHLAGMELKEKWKELEPELDAVEKDLTAAGAKVEQFVSPKLDAMAAGLRKFAEDVRKAAQKVTDSKIDEPKVDEPKSDAATADAPKADAAKADAPPLTVVRAEDEPTK